LFWPGVAARVKDLEAKPEFQKWYVKLSANNEDVLMALNDLDANDERRLLAMVPHRIKQIFSTKKGTKLEPLHVVNRYRATAELTTIRRSSASELFNSDGSKVSLRGIFKKTTRKTAILKRRANEETEYQFFHRAQAR